MCTHPVGPFGPDWDAKAVWHNISQAPDNMGAFTEDKVTELMVLIRTHPGYMDQLLPMLLLLRSLKRTDIRVIVIPTERDAYTTLLQPTTGWHATGTTYSLSIKY